MLNNCLKGKKEAQQQLYNKYAAAMLGLCYRYTKSYEDAEEDVLQDGFIRVFTNLHQFNRMRIRCMDTKDYGQCCHHLSHKHSRYRKEMSLDDITLHRVSDENPEVKLDTKQLIETIRQLQADIKPFLIWLPLKDINQNEVATLLEMNTNTVRSQYSRAKNNADQDVKRK